MTKAVKMTKLEAIRRVLADNGGAANWGIIYDNVEKYYPAAKQSDAWKAGVRGILYREIQEGGTIKKIGLGSFALANYQEEKPPARDNKIRMHSFIEGICLELGNFKDFETYTADPSAVFRDNIKLGNLTSLKKLPEFTYPEIVSEAKKIDVVWLNKKGFRFPQKVFEIVDSASTLTGAFNRSLQLLNFRTEYYIIAPEKHKAKFDKKIQLAPYNSNAEKFKFVNYNQIIKLYENTVKTNKMEGEIFSF